MRILYAGPLSPGQTSEMRRRALERLGHDTIPIDLMEVVQRYSAVHRKVQWRLRCGPMIHEYNRRLRAALANWVDCLWVDKGMFVLPAVLDEARRAGIRHAVHYSPDNYLLRQNSSRHLWRGLGKYSLIVTTKTFNVERLRSLGAKSVYLSGNAYDPEVHCPMTLSQAEREIYGSEVLFVGRWEPDRGVSIGRLLSLGVKVSIWGTGWERARSAGIRDNCRFKPVMGTEYAKAISGARISLGFLSRLAEDRITQRSVEIPACGGFLLANRTEEHLAHFEEGKEAGYFASDDELCEKVQYYLTHEAERAAIAAAGRQRCIASGYSYDDRLREILNRLGVSDA